MVRPPLFSKGVYARHGQALQETAHPPDAPATRRLTAGGVAALVLLAVCMLIVSALIGIVAALAPAMASGATSQPALDGTYR